MSVPASSPGRVIGIGASAGGIDALLKVLVALPEELPHAVLVVVHMPADAESVLPHILDRRCRPPVLGAWSGAQVRLGHVYVARPDRHLMVDGPVLALDDGPPENGVRPSVDVLLRSLADAYGPAAVAVVLSGALGDGARGARAVADAGGRVLVQDPRDAIVSSMPERAIAATGGRAEVLAASAIGEELAALGPPAITARRLRGAPA